MKRFFRSNLFLIFTSTLLSFVVCEVIYRGLLFGKNTQFEFLRDPAYYAIYPQDENEDLFNETYWKLNYLFDRGFDLTDPHPLLGWAGMFNKSNYTHSHVDTTGRKRPVLLYGNSFSMCVDTVKCFEDYLNKDSVFSSENHLYNYGVGGYGVDQITLLFDQTIEKYKNPFVLFGVLTTDLDRSMLQLRDAPKPYFKLKNDELVLKGTPLTKTTKEYIEEHPPNIPSYILNRMYNIVTRRLDTETQEKLDYIDSLKAINASLLKRSFARLKQLNIDFVVVIFQPGEHNPRDWRLSFLRKLCMQEAVPYICDIDVLAKNKIKTGNVSRDFFIPVDGHPNSLANKVVADEMKKLVLDSAYFQQLIQCELKEKDSPQNQSIGLMKMYIGKDDNWLKDIISKAEKNAISVDSQMTLDALYMAGLESLPE